MSGNEFVLVCAGRSYTASARLVFRGLGKRYCLREDLINMIHERYMDLVHEHSMVLVPIYAALERAWVQRTLRVPITRHRERDLLIDKLNAITASEEAATAARHATTAARNVRRASRNVMRARAHILHDLLIEELPWNDRNATSLADEEERLAVAEQRAASDAANATSLAETEAKGDARDAVRATEIARIGPMMKIPDWVEAVVLLS